MDEIQIVIDPGRYLTSLSLGASTDEEIAHYQRERDAFFELADDLLTCSKRIHIVHPFFGSGTGGGVENWVLLVALSSNTLVPLANSFLQFLIAYLKRYDGREIIVERGDIKITLKNRSLPEEKDLIALLFPEISREQDIKAVADSCRTNRSETATVMDTDERSVAI